jgi:hypothetical protein
MAAKDPFKAFLASFKRQQSVTEPIASDVWTFNDAAGKRRTTRIEVGIPRRIPNDKNEDWFCPVFIDGWTPHVVPAMGVGPVDSLMNAITLIRSFHEQIAWLQISHRTSKPRRRRKWPRAGRLLLHHRRNRTV